MVDTITPHTGTPFFFRFPCCFTCLLCPLTQAGPYLLPNQDRQVNNRLDHNVTKSRTFGDLQYGERVFAPYISAQLEKTSRIDLVWHVLYTYLPA